MTNVISWRLYLPTLYTSKRYAISLSGGLFCQSLIIPPILASQGMPSGTKLVTGAYSWHRVGPLKLMRFFFKRRYSHGEALVIHEVSQAGEPFQPLF